MNQPRASEKLDLGKIYSRKRLREQFKINDATLNTGVFKPKGYDSVWLFVTRKKQAHQTKYVDLLNGDTLRWLGQASGKTDLMIIEHRRRGLEVLLFYRDSSTHYADAGFRYEGCFEYLELKAGHPTSFVLRRTRE